MSGQNNGHRHRSYRQRDRSLRDGDWVHDKFLTHSPRQDRSRSPPRVSKDTYRPSGYTTPPPGRLTRDGWDERTGRSGAPVQSNQPAQGARLGDGYHTFESTMEQKAIKENRRRPFFQFLNCMRHKANENHKRCTPQARAYIADKETWEKFWPHERFTGDDSKPGAEAHSGECKASSKNKVSSNFPILFGQSSGSVVADRVANRNRQSSATVVVNRTEHLSTPIFANRTLQSSGPIAATRTFTEQQQQSFDSSQLLAPMSNLNFFSMPPQQNGPLPQASPSAQLLYALLNSQALHKNRGTIIMIDTHPLVFPDTGFITATFFTFQSERFDDISQVCDGLRCHLFYHRVAPGDLLLWGSPKFSGDVGALMAGHAFLEGWLVRIQRFGQVKPSVYWNEIQARNLQNLSYVSAPVSSLSGPSTRLLVPPNVSTHPKSEMELHQMTSTLKVQSSNVSAPKSSRVLSDRQISSGLKIQTSNVSTAKPSEALPDHQVVDFASSEISVQLQGEVDHWAEYKEAFKPSEVELLLIEEKVKTEGILRMVSDQVTGEIVTLRELLARAVRRSAVPFAGGHSVTEMVKTEERDVGGEKMIL